MKVLLSLNLRVRVQAQASLCFCLLLLLVSSVTVAGFQAASPLGIGIRPINTAVFATTKVKTDIAAVAVEKQDKLPAIGTIDHNIYRFNKFLVDTSYNVVCLLYPVRGTDRDYARFFVLETVARVPYFAYLTVLHFRETFGERDLEYKMRAHYAEADNEFHHLLIMESLGGNKNGVDRWLAHAMAFAYYWYVVIVYLISEPAAYHLSELIEDHAYNTYKNFLTEHKDSLMKMPVPEIARQYYCEDDAVWLDLFHVHDSANDEKRSFNQRENTKLDSLYDVFVHIRDDEKEHWMALCNLVQTGDIQGQDASVVQSTQPTTSA